MGNLTAIVNAVEIDDGIKYLPMWQIKQYAAPHRDRLSRDLSNWISEQLKERGLITLPTVLPTNEMHWVFVIKEDSAIGQAVSLAARVVGISRHGVPTPPGIHEEYARLAKQVG